MRADSIKNVGEQMVQVQGVTGNDTKRHRGGDLRAKTEPAVTTSSAD
ncbi:hypothetical protein [uncultured Microbulbifer sp.]|nr:hypothetical protein [uncultured Microbulbifer sp.]